MLVTEYEKRLRYAYERTIGSKSGENGDAPFSAAADI